MTLPRGFHGLVLLALTSCKTAPTAPPVVVSSDPPAIKPSTPASPPTAPAPAPHQVRILEGVTEYALGNGMQVLLFPDNSKDTVTVNVTYLVGSRHEGYGETGMAHLLEHMLFKGSTNVSDLDKQLKKRGATYNASTWFDRTNYFETMPATEDNVQWALRMEADRMVNALIRQEDLSSEFSVVRNEMESGENNPNEILEERMLSTAYLWHNYGKSTIGARSDVEGVKAPTLKKFYAKYYQPDNAVLVVAGKFDAAKTLTEINASFGAVPRPSRVIEPTYTTEPVQDGDRVVTLRRVGDVGLVGLMYHTVADSDPDGAASDAIVDLLTAEPSGRLYKALVQTGMATRVFTSGFPAHDPGVIEVFATVRADKPLEPVKAKMLEIVEGFAKAKVTEEEVARFRAKRKKGAKLLFSNTQALATQLSEHIGTGDWRLLFLSRDRAVSVTRDQVQHVAETYLKSSNRTLGMFVPEKQNDRAPLTQAPDVAKALETYKGQPPPSEGEAFVYTVDNIEKRTRRGKLANGLAWAMMPKETRGDAVRFRLTLRYGTAKDFTGKVEAAELLPQLLRRGTKQHTFQQLSDELDLLEANLQLGGGPGQLSATITTTRDNLAGTLKLLDEILRQPAWPAAELEIARKDRLTQLDEAKSQPDALAFTSFQRKVQPKQPTNPQYVPMPDEKIARIKAVTLGDIKQLYGMLGASNAQLTVLGDFDDKAVEQQVAGLWGEWKSPRPFKRFEEKFVDTPASVEVIDTPDKENALIVAGLAIAMRDDDPDYAAMQVVNYVLGSGFGSRLVNRLREKDGLSYGAGSFFFADAFDSIGALIANAILAPQNSGKGMTAMIEELEKVAKDGLTAQELEDARKGYVKSFDRRLSSDDYVLGQLHQGLYIGRTMQFQAQVNSKVAALTLDQVNVAAKKYLVPSRLIRVTGADKKKAEAGAK